MECLFHGVLALSPNGELVNGMLEDALIVLKATGEKPTIHTDRGCHYRWPGLDSANGPDTASALYVEKGVLTRQFCL
jgi:hypothetical protein